MHRFVHCLLLASLLPASLHAAGNAVNGKLLYQSRCIACHSVDVSMAGPAHRDVVGRKAGSLPGFAYSPALKRAGLTWNDKTLNAWLANPEKLVPGQAMNFSVTDAQARADLIAYLETISRHAATAKP